MFIAIFMIVNLHNPLMGTETFIIPLIVSLIHYVTVNLHNPLMGTETIERIQYNEIL